MEAETIKAALQVWLKGAQQGRALASWVREAVGFPLRHVAVAVLAMSVCPNSANAGDVRLEPGKTQVYLADGASAVTKYAAEELANRLSESYGCEVPIRDTFLEGYVAIVVGDNDKTRAAGIDVNTYPRDSGIIRIKGARIYIAGFDAPYIAWRDGTGDVSNHDVAAALRWGGGRGNCFERATLFAVYEFLERFVGVRYYFPGELGTIVPRHRAIVVPEGDVVNRPDYTSRLYSAWSDGEWFGPGGGTNRVIQLYRNRLQTESIPCCHGQNEFCYLWRYAVSHPEYFRQMPDGTRNTDPTACQPGQLCHTSAVWDEIYEDVKSYFLGEGAERRGIPNVHKKSVFGWNVNTREIKGLGKFADIMPQDGFQPCCCQSCKAAFGDGTGAYATDLIWGNVAKVCNRLKDDGVPGTVTMMSYFPYSDVPKISLPDNLMVMVARMGPWAVGNPKELSREQNEIRAWSQKLGKKVWLWNYPCKFRGEYPDIPEHCPRAWAKYYQSLSDDIFGAFAQTASTKWMYNHLNYYVFGKVCWKNDIDVDSVISEYYRLMYGAGADQMRRFFEALERLWIGGVVGNVVESELGPVVSLPDEYMLFHNVYNRKNLMHLSNALDKAANVVESGSLEARRIELMRREIFKPLEKRALGYLDGIDVQKALASRRTCCCPSLLANGDFAEGRKGWSGGYALDTNVMVTAGASARLVSTSGEWREVTQQLNVDGRKLKPSTRYRLSYFVRYENVVPVAKKLERKGIYGNVWCGKNLWNPNIYGLKGTADWTFQSFDFISPPEENTRAYVSLKIINASGKVWFDGVRLEELSPREQE